MKKALFYVLLIASISSFGQGFKIGLRASAGLSWLGINTNESKNTYITGPSYGIGGIGIASEFKLSNRFWLKPELMYLSSAGSKTYHGIFTDAYGQPFEQLVNFDPFKIKQIQLPVLLRVNIKKIYFIIGPSVSKFINTRISNNIPGSTSYTEGYTGSDIGLNTGIGIDVVKKPQISLELRHYRGLLKKDVEGYHQSFAQVGISVLLY